MIKILKHLHTINKHRRGVISNARHVGLFWHCLKHDLSKYSPKEFFKSAKNYSGVASPINGERKITGGYSSICQHHLKHNPHHWEYWTDFYYGNIVVKTMPYKYALECVCDMISASKVYNGKNFSNEIPLKYFLSKKDHFYMSKATEEFILWCFQMFADSGWKNLNKKNTKEKYNILSSKFPDVEIIENIKHDN